MNGIPAPSPLTPSRESGGPRPVAPWALAIWRAATSPVTFVILALLWCLDLGAGSLFAYYEPRVFGSLDAYPFGEWLEAVGRRALPDSLWVYFLVALTWMMIFSLLLCTANWFFRRRRRMKGVGEFLIHLGFMLVFAGFVIGSVAGSRVQGVRIAVGQTVEVGPGLALRVDRIDPLVSPGGDLLDSRATVALLEGGQETASGVSRTNHPLIRGPTVVYSRSAFQAGRGPGGGMVIGGVFDIHTDPGVWWVITGGIVLGLGTIWSLLGYLGIFPGMARE
jgi:hypothetical protein